MTELAVISKIVKAPIDKLVAEIGRLQVQRTRRFHTDRRSHSRIPTRALSVPRKTGEHAATFENCRLTRMISRGFAMPSM